MMNSRKKQGIMPFFVAQISVSVLMSCRVVTKTDLGNVDVELEAVWSTSAPLKPPDWLTHNGFLLFH
jgi:hypothetical protein